MLKNITSIEIKKVKEDQERVYQMICDNHSPLGELYDVLCEMRGYVVDRLKAHHEAEAASCKKEEVKASTTEKEKAQEIVVECA